MAHLPEESAIEARRQWQILSVHAVTEFLPLELIHPLHRNPGQVAPHLAEV